MPYKDPDKRREAWNRASKKKYDKRLRYLNQQKLKVGCLICGFKSYSSALDFHILDPSAKEEDTTTFVRWSQEKLKEEMERYVVLCANCHRGVHSGDIPFIYTK